MSGDQYFRDICAAADSRALAAKFRGQYSIGGSRGDYEAFGGISGWGIRDNVTGEFVVDAYDSEADAWAALEREIEIDG